MRYFYVSYYFKSQNGTGFGCIGRSEEKGYPSKTSLVDAIKNNSGIQDVVILSVQEMTENDFHEFHGLTNQAAEEAAE